MLIAPQGNEIDPITTAFNAADYERLVIFKNPFSSSAREAWPRTQRLMQAASELGMQAMVVATQADHEAMAETVSKETGEGDLLAVVSGDGGTSNFLRALWYSGNQSPVAVLGGGDANDLAHNLHTGRYLKHPVRMLRTNDSRIGQLHPLEVTVCSPDSVPVQDVAFGYFGLGYTAIVGGHFNSPEFRERIEGRGAVRRSWPQMGVVLGKAPEAPVLDIISDDGERALVIERNFPNGEKEAKYARYRGMHSLLPKAGILDMPLAEGAEASRGQRYRTIIAGVGRAFLGRFDHFDALSPQAMTVRSSSGEIPTQIDGEATIYPNDSYFSVRVSQRSVSVLTTR